MCRQAKYAGNVGMEPLLPETFLAEEPCPLPGDAKKMCLVAALLCPVVAQDAGVERIEFTLEWATALVQTVDSGTWLRVAPAQRTVETTLQALAELARGRPSCLAAAPQSVRTWAARSARMAAKHLELVQRASLRANTTV